MLSVYVLYHMLDIVICCRLLYCTKNVSIRIMHFVLILYMFIVYVYFCTEPRELLMQPQSHATHYPMASHSRNMSGEPVVRELPISLSFSI